VSSGRTLFDATVVNFLNPGPYLGWSLVIGPLLLEGWRPNPLNGIALLSGFYLTMFLFSMVLIILFDFARDRGPKLQHFLLWLSALFLALFGIYQLASGLTAILSGN
jgi:threonine/homoserine/homoserine lactone efflux protein